MKKKILIALGTVQVILLAVWLVDPNWWHTGRKMVATGQYNTAKYLSSRNVTAFAEDAKHHIWIGTSEGLNIFDGHNFIQLLHDGSDSTTLPDDNIKCIFHSKDNRMFVGTANGLAEYIGAYQFRNFNIPSTAWGVTQIAETARGEILVNNGADVYVVGEDSVKPYFHFRLSYPLNYLVPDRSGGFWTIEQDKLTHYNKEKQPDRKLVVPHANVDYYHCDGDTLWVAQSRFVTGIDLNTNRVVYSSKKDLPILPTTLFPTQSHKLLLNSGYHGLYSLDLNNDLLTKVSDSELHLSHKDVTISALFRDNDNNVWIGYQEGGFQVVSAISTPLASSVNSALSQVTSGESVISLGSVADGIIGATEDRVFYYRPSAGTTTLYPFYDIFPDSPFFRQTLSSVVPHDAQSAWLVSNVRILSCLLHDGKISVLRRVYSRQHLGPPLGKAIRMGDDIYVTSGSRYIIKAQFESDKADSILVDHKDYDAGAQLAALPDGRVLIVMKNMQMAVIRPNGKKAQLLKTACANRPTNFVPSAILCDRRGRVWIGSKRNGLYHFNPSTGDMRKDSIVPDKDIQSIVEGSDGLLWIFSHDNILVYNADKAHFYFYPLTGVSNWQSSQPLNFRNACFLPQSNAMVTGTSSGCMALPVVKNIEAYRPALSFTGLFVEKSDGRPQLVNSEIKNGDKFTFSHTDNDLTVYFGSNGYNNRGHYLYQYKLEGHDLSWQSATSMLRAHFSDLAPGSYKLRLRLVASPSEPPVAEASIHIKVKSAFWLSLPALWFYLMLFLALVAYANRLYLHMRTERMELARVSRDHERDKLTNEMNMNFFANVSHEFRNPLTIIAGPLMVLRDDKSLPQHARHLINMVCKSVNRMLRLIDQMLDFNQLETDVLRLRVDQYDIAAELAQIVGIFSESAELRNIHVEQEGLHGNLYGWIDRDKLEKIMSNLLTNALKHVPDGGTIRVSLQEVQPDGQPSNCADNSSDSHGRMITVEVFNNGNNIAPDKLPFVFRRYYQTGQATANHQYGWGTGLGLYYVKRLVTLHRGTIDVVNAPGGGVTFRFSLPVDEAVYREAEHLSKDEGAMRIPIIQEDNTAEKKVEENQQVVNRAAKRPVVMMIDDDTDVAQYVRSIFSGQYVVVNRYSAESALESMEEVSPDIILCDVVMGEMSGYEFCRRIKNNLMYSHIPVILLTAKSNITEQVEGLQTGASAYVVKPFDPRYLKALVESQLKGVERIRQILSEGEPMKKTPDGLSEQDRKFMEQVYELMEHHLQDNDLNVTTISAGLLISPSKFNYKLKELTGESPGAFFRKFKLNRAARLLREGGHNVSEVAYMTGFGTVSYFSVAFKKQFGVSPSEFK